MGKFYARRNVIAMQCTCAGVSLQVRHTIIGWLPNAWDKRRNNRMLRVRIFAPHDLFQIRLRLRSQP